MAFSEDFGRRISTKRKLLGLTAPYLGKQMSPPVTKQSIGNWEKGRNLPNADQVAQLCRLLVLSPAHLVLGLEGGLSPRAGEIGELYDKVSPDKRKKIEGALELLDLRNKPQGGLSEPGMSTGTYNH